MSGRIPKPGRIAKPVIQTVGDRDRRQRRRQDGAFVKALDVRS